jgi:hypothetical protein
LYEKEDTDACLCLEQQRYRYRQALHQCFTPRPARLLAHKLASCDATGIDEYIRW